jgi:hypothetical protein
MGPYIINTPEIQNLFEEIQSKYSCLTEIDDSSHLIVGFVDTKDESLHVIRPIIGKEGKSLSYVTDITGVLLIWHTKLSTELEGFLIWAENETEILYAEKFIKKKVEQFRKLNKEKIQKDNEEKQKQTEEMLLKILKKKILSEIQETVSLIV